MIRHYKEAFLRLFYPATCEVCHAALGLEESILCRDCAARLDALSWPMEETLVEERFEYLDHVWALYAYESPLKELLHGVKYARKDYLLRTCREKMVRLAQAIVSDFWYDAILPVPIDRFKLVKRHFNQAEILAEMIAPWLTPPVRRSLLAKRHFIPSQTALTREERAVNVYGAFRLKDPRRVAGGSFLLLDDVLTTGATANEAARLLKLRGAKRVDFLALARTVAPQEKNRILSAALRAPLGRGSIAQNAPAQKQFEIRPADR
jgi:ComF family protein